MNPLVSIIVPCYNQAQYLSETLDSVLAQIYPSWECIIVNDGSPDNTEEVAKVYCEKDKRFKYLYKENGGISSARNFGIIQSNGIYLLPLDADDKISNTYIQKALDILLFDKNITVVYCEAELFGEQNGKWNLPKFSYEEMLFYNSVFCSAIFRREDYNKTVGYNTNMVNGWEDWDFWLNLIELGSKFYQLPETHFFYRVRDKSRTRSMDSKDKVDLHKQLFLNHIDLYINTCGVPQEAYQKVSFAQNSYKKIVNSREYRLGKMIITPLRKIKKLFWK